jgi:hypothetical protein
MKKISVIFRLSFLILLFAITIKVNSEQYGRQICLTGSSFRGEGKLPDGNIVNVTDYGAKPGSYENAAPALILAVEACRNKPGVKLIFPEGRYDFWPDQSIKEKLSPWDKNEMSIGICMKAIKNLILEGNGSEFIFHGKMVPIALTDCADIKLQNFKIDWDRPFISQGTIKNVTDEYLDLTIDKAAYPWIIQNERLFFTGEGWKSNVVHYCLFDKDKKEIVYLTRDNPMGNIFNSRAEEMTSGNIRFYGKTNYKPEPGTIVALYSQREAVGIGLYHCSNTGLSNIRIYHSMGTGLLAFFCENVTMYNVNIEANEKKSRVFSSQADATYFPNCKGLIKIENCKHTGQTDDWANFRGTYTTVVKKSGASAIEVTYKWSPAIGFYNPGDKVTFLNPKLMQRGTIDEIKTLRLLESGNTEITFSEPLPEEVIPGYAVENMTWVPEVEVRNCTIPRKNRARGILLSTANRAVIEDNLFQTAGSAILIEGDIKDWFEAGAVTDVLIRHNIFEDCLSSAESGAWNWGEAIICITPSHHPENDNTEPYHRNIRIEDNIFKFYDYPLLYGRSVRGLYFKNNKIQYTNSYPQHGRKVNFYLDGCRNAEISGNVFDEKFPGRNVELHHMRLSDVKITKDQKLKIEYQKK